MIDLGLSKLAIIGVVALIVIGPEKLPRVARMAGTLYGRAQRYLHNVKSEVSREIELEELRNLHKEVHESAQSLKSEVEQSLASHVDEVESLWDGHATDKADVAFSPSFVSTADIERKARNFRRKKVGRTSAVPSWYKHRNGVKTHVLSGAARVRKFRSVTNISKTSFF